MDALSDILRVVGLTGGVFLEADFTAPWTVAGQVSPEACRPFMDPPRQLVGFHYVIEGGLEVGLDGRSVGRASAGEAVMLAHNDMHAFGSSLSLSPAPVSELMPTPGAAGLPRIEYGGGGARTRLVCGFMGGDDQLAGLLASLPPVLVVELATLPGGDWMGRMFTYAAQILAEDRPGAATVLAKVAELLFIETVRRHFASLPAEETGWLAGLRDPAVARALALLHGRAATPWTADALAREVNMSRSAFADRFTAIIGQPPMRYLTAWRMRLARHELLAGRKPIAEIAFEVGYESEAAFTRAFRREQGLPPAAWRKAAGAAGSHLR
jgi:AraC-like DNA-binding protein